MTRVMGKARNATGSETAQFERIVTFSPAWDKRSADQSKNYGIHCVELRMVLKGPLGATQFVLYTDWHLPEVEENWLCKFPHHQRRPTPADLGYHSYKPMYKDQPSSGNCQYLDGHDCYYDGSGLNAERIFDVLRREGSDGVWRELQAYYEETFSDAQP